MDNLEFLTRLLRCREIQLRKIRGDDVCSNIKMKKISTAFRVQFENHFVEDRHWSSDDSEFQFELN
ncbi:MAG: hypothetical protein DWI29_01680 [Planctomycetota bacterium]|nr:MAG: hypothetical protein DWI29_01680 [Planctomycetota bacterium]